MKLQDFNEANNCMVQLAMRPGVTELTEEHIRRAYNAKRFSIHPDTYTHSGPALTSAQYVEESTALKHAATVLLRLVSAPDATPAADKCKRCTNGRIGLKPCRYCYGSGKKIKARRRARK